MAREVWPELATAVGLVVPTAPRSAIGGIHHLIPVVRDLGSGMPQLALPIEDGTAQQTVHALRLLFCENGVPLMSNSHNGLALAPSEIGEFLEAKSVRPLFSPPNLPSYDGACLASIRPIKTRAHQESARNDRHAEWTCGALEAERSMA